VAFNQKKEQLNNINNPTNPRKKQRSLQGRNIGRVCKQIDVFLDENRYTLDVYNLHPGDAGWWQVIAGFRLGSPKSKNVILVVTSQHPGGGGSEVFPSFHDMTLEVQPPFFSPVGFPTAIILLRGFSSSKRNHAIFV